MASTTRKANARERVTRPAPERTDPIRGGWLSLFAPPAGAGAEAEENDPGEDGPDREPMNEALARAVNLGYQVVDDYIRQGQNAARLMRTSSYGPEAIRHDLQEIGVRSFQYASDLAGLWFEFVGMAASGEGMTGPDARFSGPRAAPPDPAAAEPPTAPEPRPSEEPEAVPNARVSVLLESSRPAEVAVEMRPVVAGADLLVHDLRAVDPAKPRLDDIRVESGEAGEAVTVRVRVPEDQPPGTYAGVVIDAATSLPVGTVSVRIPG